MDVTIAVYWDKSSDQSKSITAKGKLHPNEISAAFSVLSHSGSLALARA